jgi:WD40-like Beta Propeller Repeat
MKRSRRSFFAATVGFGVIAIVWIFVGTPSPMTAQPSYSDWSPPHNLTIINSTANDAGPTLSKDRLSLYFGSNRSGSLGGNTDIWVSHRDSEEGDWGPPTNLGAVINSTAEETSPNLSRDGHWLFFMSRRPGSQANAMGVVGFDIWVSYREHVHDDFDWQPPINVGPPVNGPSFDQSPFFFENEEAGIRQLFFTRTTPVTGNDIFVSNQLPDGTFGPPTLVSELNSALSDAGSSIRFDGLEVFFFSRRSGAGTVGLSDLWTATRDSVLDPWSPPTPLGAVVNSADLDFDPFIASDRETLYFASTRVLGGVGGQDLWVTTRTKEKHKS